MTVLDIFLCVLVGILTVVLIIITVFAVKLIKELTLTLKSVRELADMTKTEIKPALLSLNEILTTVKNVSNAANHRVNMLKDILTAVLSASCIAFTNVKNKGGFFSGLISGFNIFRKKRR